MSMLGIDTGTLSGHVAPRVLSTSWLICLKLECEICDKFISHPDLSVKFMQTKVNAIFHFYSLLSCTSKNGQATPVRTV